MKIRIARREAKESIYWLELVLTHEVSELESERLKLIEEAVQIRKILSSILNKLG